MKILNLFKFVHETGISFFIINIIILFFEGVYVFILYEIDEFTLNFYGFFLTVIHKFKSYHKCVLTRYSKYNSVHEY